MWTWREDSRNEWQALRVLGRLQGELCQYLSGKSEGKLRKKKRRQHNHWRDAKPSVPSLGTTLARASKSAPRTEWNSGAFHVFGAYSVKYTLLLIILRFAILERAPRSVISFLGSVRILHP